ncbi:hypothetical protein, partial [Paraburkholderia hospita]|uniref:hypothetical protein n=1 Tax=Paraburkholderia hospita TaxID=169430 RepID=UPI001ABD1C9F
MPPAFNLSQDQTLQFKPVTVFRLFYQPVAHSKSLTNDSVEFLNPSNLPQLLPCETRLLSLFSDPKITARRHRAPTLIGC